MNDPTENAVKPNTGFRTGFVALVGRPSAGKSTLLNRLCGHKVAITSPKPQTTRNVIRGIVNQPSSQLVFLDTPGFTGAEDLLADRLREELRSALREADVVLYLLDLSRPAQPLCAKHLEKPGKVRRQSSDWRVPAGTDGPEPLSEEQGLLALLRELLTREPRPLCLGLNKSDLLGEPQRQERIAEYLAQLRQYFPDLSEKQCCLLSAKNGEGQEELLWQIGTQLPAQATAGRGTEQRLYDEDIYTDQEPQFRIGELIREQALSFCGRELPYALYVEVADLEYQNSKTVSEQEGALWVRAFLQVERESQKGILVGKGGSRIREIRKRSTREIRKQFSCPVHLDLQVKVDYKWRRKRP